MTQNNKPSDSKPLNINPNDPHDPEAQTSKAALSAAVLATAMGTGMLGAGLVIQNTHHRDAAQGLEPNENVQRPEDEGVRKENERTKQAIDNALNPGSKDKSMAQPSITGESNHIEIIQNSGAKRASDPASLSDKLINDYFNGRSR